MGINVNTDNTSTVVVIPHAKDQMTSRRKTLTSAMTQAESGLESAANGQLAQVDAQHQSSSAHFFTILPMISAELRQIGRAHV